MLKQFKEFITSNNLFNKKEDKILLAVSGGMDSVVMSVLFYQAGIAFGIAHCNFNLRGSASGADEDFVKNLAGRYKVPFFLKRFNTKQHIKKKPGFGSGCRPRT